MKNGFQTERTMQMTQLKALKVAYEELSSMMPDGENDEIFEAAEVIEKMIHAKEKQSYKRELKNAPKSRADKKYQREIDSMFNDLFDSM